MRNDDLAFWKAVYLGALATGRVVGLENPHEHCAHVANQAVEALCKQRVDLFPDPEPRSLVVTTDEPVEPGDAANVYWLCDGLFRATAIKPTSEATSVMQVQCGNMRIFVHGDSHVRQATAGPAIQFRIVLRNEGAPGGAARRLTATLTGLFVSQVSHTDDSP